MVTAFTLLMTTQFVSSYVDLNVCFISLGTASSSDTSENFAWSEESQFLEQHLAGKVRIWCKQ